MNGASAQQGPLRAVVDASVAIKLFVAEALSDRADSLFTRLLQDPPARFYVPDLFYVECTKLLWKYVQRLGLPADDARAAAADLLALSLAPMPTEALIPAALEIALQHGATAYDACYVALAEQLGLPLITADERLARRFEGTPFQVEWLGAVP